MDEFNDPFSLATQSRATGRIEEGREVRLVGPPILASDPRLNNASVPQELQNHPLLQEHYFYTLPPALFDLLLHKLGEELFDAELLELEQALSIRNGNH